MLEKSLGSVKLRSIVALLALLAVTACGTAGDQRADVPASTPSPQGPSDIATEPAGSELATSEPARVREGEYLNPAFEPVFADPSVIRAENGFFYAFRDRG